MPQRIQRKRTKGWRMPENTVYVGRGTKWGNPWPVRPEQDAETVVRYYGKLLSVRQEMFESNGGKRKFEGLPYYDDIRTSLRGKNLSCWCKEGTPCHADILLKIANS